MNSIGANDAMAPPAADLIAPSLKTRVISAVVLLHDRSKPLEVAGLAADLFAPFVEVVEADPLANRSTDLSCPCTFGPVADSQVVEMVGLRDVEDKHQSIPP